jgi:hypothetical protein
LSVTGQVGCLAIVVIVLATWVGRWLDGLVGEGRPWFTVGLLVLSVPVVLFLTLKLALRSTRSLNGRTESSRGKDLESDNSIGS